jgi:hypothetical protein
MPVLEAISFASSISKIIAAIWANGSRFLWSIAVASAAAAAVIRVGAYFDIPKAQPVWEEYGLTLTLLAVVVAVFAAFKMRTERRNIGLALIADEQQSFWHHAKQQDGSTITHFALRFHATNMNDDGSIHLSKVRLNWPWVKRSRIFTTTVMTQHPTQNMYSADYGIQAHKRRACSADIMSLGTVGGVGRKKPMRVSIGVQDHAGRWHKLVFRGLRDPSIRR